MFVKLFYYQNVMNFIEDVFIKMIIMTKVTATNKINR